MKVLFVCSANAWQSPIAEALLKKLRPDIQRLRADRVVSKGNTVMVEYTWSGTHTKDWAGIPVKGKKFEAHGVEIFVFEGGKVKLYKTYANPDILMQKLRE